jgi:hypothetical protein
MASLTIIMVLVYLIYGSRLIKTLTKTGGGAASKSPVIDIYISLYIELMMI